MELPFFHHRDGSDIGKFVTPNVEKAVNEKFDERRRNGKL